MNDIKLKAYDGDHAHLIGELLDEVKPRKIVRLVITRTAFASRWKTSPSMTGSRLCPCMLFVVWPRWIGSSTPLAGHHSLSFCARSPS